MKRLYLSLLVLLFSSFLSAQTFTTVTGTIQDTSGQTWNYGSMTVSLQTTQPGTPLNQGHPITDNPQVVALSGTGTFSFTLDSNTAILPIGSFWNFTICPNATAPCVTVGLPVTGTTEDISTTINPHLGPLIINATNTNVVRAYSDTEAVGGNGALYWRTTDNTLRGCQATPAQTCGNGGVGTWTSIVSGGGITNLTALFGITLTPNPATTTATIALTNASIVAFQIPFVDATGTTLNWVTPGTNGCYLGLNTSSGPFWDGNLCSTSGTPNNLTYNGTITATSFIGTGPYYLNTVIPASPPTPTASQSAFAVGSDGNWYLSNNGGAFAEILTGTGGSGVTGTGTNNTVAKWTGTSSIGNSSLIDNGTNPVGISNGTDLGLTGGYDWQAPNNGTTGTTLNKLACDDGSGKAVICSHTTSTTNAPLGVAVHGVGSAAPGTTGNTGICLVGFCTILFDTSATAGHYAQESATTDGELADVGATVPTNGQEYFYIFSSNSGAGTTAVIRDLTGSELNAASSGGGGSSTTIQINGASVTKANKVNFNNTTPVAGTNGLNITWQTSISGTTTSVSAEIVGNGTATQYLSGTGVFSTPAGTGVTTSSPLSGTTALSCPTCTVTIASGTSAMGTSAISSGTCASVVTTTATGTATTDIIIATPNTDPTGVTGYAPASGGSLYIQAYPTSGNVNFKVCNNTSGSITPSALTLNFRVVR